MSTIEERLIADIAAVTRGVDMTESDLRDARNTLDDRIESARQHGRRRTGMVAAAAVVAAAVVGVTAFQLLDGDDKTAPPATPPTTDPDASFLTGEPPTVELLEGLWRLDNGEVMVRFSPDGSVSFDENGTMFSDPLATGTYEINGDVVTLISTGNACVGEETVMRASLASAGLLRFVTQSDVSACSLLPRGQQALEQVLPSSPEMAGLVFSKDPHQPLSPTTELFGVWLAEGGGYVLEIDPGGAYYVASGSGALVDQGQWSLRQSDLTLTSSNLSSTCTEGDQLVLSSLRHAGSGTASFRGNVQQNACGGDWTPLAWILIPNGGGDVPR
jgi:hypothetical protein